MSSGGFAAATAVDTTQNNSDETALFTAEIFPGWDIMGNANGGYLMGLLGRAALAHTGRPDVVSMSANFLAPGKAGPIDIAVEEVRLGRRFATVRSTFFPAGSPKASVTSTIICGDITAHDGPTMVTVQPPSIPEPADCTRSEPTETFPPPFVGKIDLRMHPDDGPAFAAKSAPQGEARFRGWFRLPESEPMDSLAVVLAGDSLPPPVFNTNLNVGWSPTVQLTVHVHRRPVTPWLLVDQRSDIIDGGAFETITSIFDQNGDVVGRARQLQLLALA